MSRKPKDPGLEDQTLWARVARTIKPLRAETRVIPPPTVPVKNSPSPAHQKRAPFLSLPQTTFDPAPLSSLSPRQVRRVRKVAIEARFDLHGMTREQARLRLTEFLIRSQGRQHTWVLVITGKGRPGSSREDVYESPRQTLRELVPQWLNDVSLKTVVSSFAPAKPGDGGTGALYIRLKKVTGKFNKKETKT